MLTLLAIYVPILLLTLAYVVINSYHLISFRLPVKGDLSRTILAVYLMIVIGLICGSILLAILGYYGL